MAEMVDATDLKSVALWRAGSIPAARTIFNKRTTSMRFFRASYYSIPLPSRAHPLCKLLRSLMIREQTTSRDVADKSGVRDVTIRGWFKTTTNSPNLQNIEAALGVFEYTLVAVPTRFLSDRGRSISDVRALKKILERAQAIEDEENISENAKEIEKQLNKVA